MKLSIIIFWYYTLMHISFRDWLFIFDFNFALGFDIGNVLFILWDINRSFVDLDCGTFNTIVFVIVILANYIIVAIIIRVNSRFLLSFIGHCTLLFFHTGFSIIFKTRELLFDFLFVFSGGSLLTFLWFFTLLGQLLVLVGFWITNSDWAVSNE